MCLLQQWLNLFDPAEEEALDDSRAMRAFVGIDLGRAAASNETTLLKFRHLLEKHHLGDPLFAEGNVVLAARDINVVGGTMVDATIIAAPSANAGFCIAQSAATFERRQPFRTGGRIPGIVDFVRHNHRGLADGFARARKCWRRCRYATEIARHCERDGADDRTAIVVPGGWLVIPLLAGAATHEKHQIGVALQRK